MEKAFLPDSLLRKELIKMYGSLLMPMQRKNIYMRFCQEK